MFGTSSKSCGKAWSAVARPPAIRPAQLGVKLGELVLDDALEAPLLHRRGSSEAIVPEELDNREDVGGIAK